MNTCRNCGDTSTAGLCRPCSDALSVRRAESHAEDLSEKQRMRNLMSASVTAFLRAGGKIDVVPIGASGLTAGALTPNHEAARLEIRERLIKRHAGKRSKPA